MRLVAMGLWVPRVAFFVAGIGGRFSRQSLPDWLLSITPSGRPGRPRITPEEMARVIWNVLRWEKGRFNNGCFVRTFTRYRFFRELGHPVVFHLGIEDRGKGKSVRNESGAERLPASLSERETGVTPASFSELRSHAWLTLDGRPFLEPESERIREYRILYTFPEPPGVPRNDPAGRDPEPAQPAPSRGNGGPR